MKRFLACLVSVALALGLTPADASAAGEEDPRLTSAASTQLLTGDEGAEAVNAALGDSNRRNAVVAQLDSRHRNWTPAPTTDAAQALESMSDDFTASRVGIGGSGALFHPLISPFDHETMIATCDMGGLFVSNDAGSHWKGFSCGGRVLTTAADPGERGVFYAGGSGLWRTGDNGASWNMIWPKASAIRAVQSSPNNSRTYYFTDDAYPDQNAVLAVCVDPGDSRHIAAVCAAGIGGQAGKHSLCESFDGGESFQLSAEFMTTKEPKDASLEKTRVFIEPVAGANATARNSRVVAAMPDGLFALDRTSGTADSAMNALYTAPGTGTIQEVDQVFEDGVAHYVALENLDDDAAAAQNTRVRLWHATYDALAANRNPADLTAEMVNDLPRRYIKDVDGEEAAYEITKHDAVTLCAPSLSRIYLGYRSKDYTNPKSESWQGISGLVSYDATREAGKRFEWIYGHRCFWTGVDADKRVAANQNHIMTHLQSRGHVNANFTMLGIAVDPQDDRSLVLTTHTGLFYSPDIDADVGYATNVDGKPKVNIYARYATLCDDDQTNGGRAANQNEYRMRSTGLEVTVSNHVGTDPFDGNHVILCLDDVGIAHSYDGGETWSHFYTKLPSIKDCCYDAVFDEGIEGVVYGAWDGKGGAAYNTGERFYQGKSMFSRSTDGGMTWDASYSTGLPDNATVVKMAVSYPRDASGAITDGERTIYVATMGYGFYASSDSGRTFHPMNAGVDSVEYKPGNMEYQSIWARDILLTEDGRLFGMTQYSTVGPADERGNRTLYRTQDERTFGNVWEWDAHADGDAGAWVKLPFNYGGELVAGRVNVRQPRAFAYDEETGMLYVAAVSVVGPNEDGHGTNFGGGLYTYADDASGRVGAGTVEKRHAPTCPDVCGESLTAIGFDRANRTWVSTEDGDVYYHEGRDAATDEGSWVQVFANTLRLCEHFDFDADGDVYLNTHGISAVRFRPNEPVLPDPGPGSDPDPDPGSDSGGDPEGGAGADPESPSEKTDLARAVVTLVEPSVTYDGNARKPVVESVVLDGEKLAEGVDYTVSYPENCTNAGTYTATITGKGAFCGTTRAVFTIAPKKATPSVSLAKKKYAYSGKARKPAVTVLVAGKKLPASSYDVKYAGARKKVGAYAVQVTLKGNYSGKKTVRFKIVPKKPRLLRVSAVKKDRLLAAWKKQTRETSGYRLQYATNKRFRKSVKTLKIANPKAKSRVIGKLKAGKRYYVRIQAYRVVGKTAYYSEWSAAKPVRTRR